MRQILTILVLSFVSCDNRYGVEFIIHNESTVTIDSVRVSTSDNKATIKLMEIQKGQTKADFLNMRDIIQADGDYFVEISTPGVTKVNNIGYYTNGFPLDERVDIYYADDTIKYKLKIRE